MARALSPAEVQGIIEEINQQEEVDRRARMLKRHKLFKDGGKEFLVEQIKREFDSTALNEMRLAPINFLKKIINKKSKVYAQSPVRATEMDQDQALIDYYVVELEVDQFFQKANRYYNLFANTALYTRPDPRTLLPTPLVVPAYMYSIVPNSFDQTQIDVWIFNRFAEEGRMAPQEAPRAGSGVESFSKERGYSNAKDLVASGEIQTDESRNYIFWTDLQHFTANDEGGLFRDPEKGDEQFVNPIGRAPVTNLAKDRDNEPWAEAGQDTIDLTMALQLGWSDLLTFAKNQGFSILTVISEEEPKKLTVGTNRAVWLRQNPEGKDPSISYVQANTPLAENKEILMDLLGLLLSTNDMNPGAISGTAKAQSATSGFHAMIEMSDTLECIKADQPVLRDAEKDFWDVLARWHNWMFDAGILRDEARALGKFSEGFEISVTYPQAKPLESDQERIATVKSLKEMGLMTNFDAMKKLHPDLTDDQIEAKLEDVEEEKDKAREKFMSGMAPPSTEPEEEDEAEDEQ